MDSLPDLLNEQARAYICGKLGCSRHFVLPLQIRQETRQVLTECATCQEKSWIELPPEGFRRFLQDAADGKIK